MTALRVEDIKVGALTLSGCRSHTGSSRKGLTTVLCFDTAGFEMSGGGFDTPDRSFNSRRFISRRSQK